MRTRPLPLSHNKTLSCVTPASRAARIAKSSIGTDASSNLTWRPSRARCTAMAPVPHPRSSASKDLWPAGRKSCKLAKRGRCAIGPRTSRSRRLEVVIGAHFLRALRSRSGPVRVAVKHQSVYRKDQQRSSRLVGSDYSPYYWHASASYIVRIQCGNEKLNTSLPDTTTMYCTSSTA